MAGAVGHHPAAAVGVAAAGAAVTSREEVRMEASGRGASVVVIGSTAPSVEERNTSRDKTAVVVYTIPTLSSASASPSRSVPRDRHPLVTGFFSAAANTPHAARAVIIIIFLFFSHLSRKNVNTGTLLTPQNASELEQLNERTPGTSCDVLTLLPLPHPYSHHQLMTRQTTANSSASVAAASVTPCATAAS